MKAFVIATLISTLMLFQPDNVSACVCVSRTPCEAFSAASAVFVGIMIEGSEKLESDPTDTKKSREAGIVRFVVEEAFKGSLGTEVRLSVSSNKGTSCGYSLTRGEKYLVYAYGEPAKLSTGVCTRTALIRDADEDFTFLRNLPPQGTGGRLSGSFWIDNSNERQTPIEGLTVVIQGPDNDTQKAIKIVTDKEGEFELRNLNPGKYRIQPQWTEQLISEQQVQEVTVTDRGCTGVDFLAKKKDRVETQIEGRVLDFDGRPASLMLHLEPSALSKARGSIIGHSNEGEGGLFKITGIAPGSYLLYFEFQTEGWKNNKKYYYPGVTDPKEAIVLEVGLAQKTRGIDFRIPSEFRVRTIEGWVAWPDGSPAAEVEVGLLCPKSSRPDGYTLEFGAPMVATDQMGRFRLQGFKGVSYWLEASASEHATANRRRVELHSPEHPLVLQDDLLNVKLILSEEGFSVGCRASTKRL